MNAKLQHVEKLIQAYIKSRAPTAEQKPGEVFNSTSNSIASTGSVAGDSRNNDVSLLKILEASLSYLLHQEYVVYLPLITIEKFILKISESITLESDSMSYNLYDRLERDELPGQQSEYMRRCIPKQFRYFAAGELLENDSSDILKVLDKELESYLKPYQGKIFQIEHSKQLNILRNNRELKSTLDAEEYAKFNRAIKVNFREWMVIVNHYMYRLAHRVTSEADLVEFKQNLLKHNEVDENNPDIPAGGINFKPYSSAWTLGAGWGGNDYMACSNEKIKLVEVLLSKDKVRRYNPERSSDKYKRLSRAHDDCFMSSASFQDFTTEYMTYEWYEVINKLPEADELLDRLTRFQQEKLGYFKRFHEAMSERVDEILSYLMIYTKHKVDLLSKFFG